MLDKHVQNHLGRQLRAIYEGMRAERDKLNPSDKPRAVADTVKSKVACPDRA